MADVDIFEGLSDEELFEGFGDGTEATAAAPEEETIEETTEPAEQADQPEDEESVEEPEVVTEQTEEEPVAEEKPSDQTFTLKHLGETKDYSRDEIIPLAQKGLDYDRIRAERDTLKAEQATLKEHEEFLKELAEMAGQSIDDLMVATKARLIVQDEKKKGNNISLENAMYRVQTDMKAKKAQAPLKSALQESFARFAELYPDVKAEDIPKEVWAEFGDGKRDLSIVYTEHLTKSELKKAQEELTQLKEKMKTLEQNEKNKKRSTGSRRSNGSPPIDHDLDGWGEY